MAYVIQSYDTRRLTSFFPPQKLANAG